MHIITIHNITFPCNTGEIIRQSFFTLPLANDYMANMTAMGYRQVAYVPDATLEPLTFTHTSDEQLKVKKFRINFKYSLPEDDYWSYHQRYAWTVVYADSLLAAQLKVRGAVNGRGWSYRGGLGGDPFRFTSSQHDYLNLDLSDFSPPEGN
tara:strand:+ start:1128 stop:1580 length:453 start_codon:yes stop_codon:yes gene_type:complete